MGPLWVEPLYPSILMMKQVQTSIHRQLNTTPRLVNPDMMGSSRYRDNEDGLFDNRMELEQYSVPAARPRWYYRDPRKIWGDCSNRRPSVRILAMLDRRRPLCIWAIIAVVALTLLGVVIVIVYISLVSALIRRLDPPAGYNGLQNIVERWREPDSDGEYKFEWRSDFSRDIVPKNCHSHNDYWRRAPLYSALAAGCISFEADIWVTTGNELLVGHSWQSTTQHRTLRSLYLDPLINIFDKTNVTVASEQTKEAGVFDTDPTVSTVLLIDFKSDGYRTWPVLLKQLQPLRGRDWLTYYDGVVLHRGPLTIVGTGNAPFNLIQQNSTDRYVFFDAPLLSVAEAQYNTTNSYYASVNMEKAVGHLWFNRFSAKQVEKLARHIHAADVKGLKSRYWGGPQWPISLRDKVWFKLTELGVGMLNVDDLTSATRWNWNWCIIAGLTLCGNS